MDGRTAAREQQIVQGPSVTSYRHHIQANGRTVAIYSRGSNGSNNTIYPLGDHLGSTDVVTNASGTVVVKESFAAFGGRRNGATWSGAPSGTDMTAIGDATRRGYTDHTMLDNIGLVHMNGRVMDPVIGRFLSADKMIDGEMDTQGWNRYAYVHNRPLTFYDPTGNNRFTEWLRDLWERVANFFDHGGSSANGNTAGQDIPTVCDESGRYQQVTVGGRRIPGSNTGGSPVDTPEIIIPPTPAPGSPAPLRIPFVPVPELRPGEGPPLTGNAAADEATRERLQAEAERAAANAAGNLAAAAEAAARAAAAWRAWYAAIDQDLDPNTILDGETMSPTEAARQRAARDAEASQNDSPFFQP